MFYTHVTKYTKLLIYSDIFFVYFVQDHDSATKLVVHYPTEPIASFRYANSYLIVVIL